MTGPDLGTFLNTHARWLRGMLRADAYSMVVYESPILRSGNTQIATLRKLYSLAGVTEMVCQWERVATHEVNLATAKKALTGNGRAEKADMVRFALQRGVKCEDDNQADAFGIFLAVVQKRFPEHLGAYGTLL